MLDAFTVKKRICIEFSQSSLNLTSTIMRQAMLELLVLRLYGYLKSSIKESDIKDGQIFTRRLRYIEI